MSGEESQSQSVDENSSVCTDPPDDEILKILVATDIHLGYYEHDAVRGNDSFRTFEEILQLAQKFEVDFVLLGGDLFHENKPSMLCYHNCITLLKKYCLGDKPVALEFLSDQSVNFSHLKNPVVNYEDPNLNVSIPVFSIHGNHDDPAGESRLSAMDILAETGLVNYFGKWNDLTQVEIRPLLLRKGLTLVALYGLSHIKDERLCRLFRDGKVTMNRPAETDDWFNLLVLHQNRAPNRGIKNYIPETVLPDFLQLVIWGHEHDCDIDPKESVNGAYISQPGSSVATSLAQGESFPKHVGFLQVYKTSFKMHKIKLNTVRPFVFREITITKPDDLSSDVQMNEFAKDKVASEVTQMLEEAKELITPNSPKLPLLRLVVFLTNESMMDNAVRLGQEYTDKVANPNDMLLFKLKRSAVVRKTSKPDDVLEEETESDQLAERVEQLVDNYFEMKNQALSLLSTKGLCEAVTRFIDRFDVEAIEDISNHQFTKTFDKFLQVEKGELNEEAIEELLTQYRAERENKPNEEMEEVERILNAEGRKRWQEVEDNNVVNVSSDENNSDSTNVGSSSTDMSTNKNARGSASTRPGRGRGSRGPRRARGRAK